MAANFPFSDPARLVTFRLSMYSVKCSGPPLRTFSMSPDNSFISSPIVSRKSLSASGSCEDMRIGDDGRPAAAVGLLLEGFSLSHIYGLICLLVGGWVRRQWRWEPAPPSVGGRWGERKEDLDVARSTFGSVLLLPLLCKSPLPLQKFDLADSIRNQLPRKKKVLSLVSQNVGLRTSCPCETTLDKRQITGLAAGALHDVTVQPKSGPMQPNLLAPQVV
ncbi:hypothetical protein B0H11DRAFT_2109713 [Mycena galericulata]|nr:hypothetical protein B0H11DRAFT_2109713 [Mycena galericulata]